MTVGEIGATNTSDSHFYINGNGVNNISINSGIGATNLVTNMVWIGSGTANANGRKSNTNMLDASGNWETQSSAFIYRNIKSANNIIIIKLYNNKC